MRLDGEVRSLIARLEEESRKYYIPHIDREDAAALAALSFTSPPGTILDLGAGIGYSTVWLAVGASVKDGSRIVAVEWDPDVGEVLERNASAIERVTGVEVEVVVEDAIKYLEGLDDNARFSMAFVDIEKYQYPKAFDLLVNRIVSGGIMAFHNAYFPRPPEEFFERLEKYDSLIIPTPQGLAVVRF